MPTLYQPQNVSTCEIAGAIAQAALHDLRVNLFAFPGFPQILIAETSTGNFSVTLSFPGKAAKPASVEFELDRKIAFAAAKRFKRETTHDSAIFEPTQKAIAELESLVSR